MAVNGERSPSAFNTTMPSASAPRVHNINGFQIATQKLPILKAGPIDEMTSKIGIQIPEMIFRVLAEIRLRRSKRRRPSQARHCNTHCMVMT